MEQVVELRVSWDADGSMRVDPPGSEGQRLLLEVAGGILTWDLPDGQLLPAAQVHDRRSAQQWLWAVYGERLAACCAQPGTGQCLVSVPSQPTPLARGALRLVYGHWAAVWWPASTLDRIPALDEHLLGLELAAQAYQVQQLFDSDTEDLADLIQRHLTGLDRLVQWRAEDPARLSARLDPVLRMLEEAADNCGIDFPIAATLDQSTGRREYALAAGAAAETGVGAGFETELGTELGTEVGTELGTELETELETEVGTELGTKAGTEFGELTSAGRVIRSGSGVNNWSRYPSGFVDAAEDSVSWVIRAAGARRIIEIQVAAGTVEPAAGVRLVARVSINDGPAERVPLVWAGHEWRGTAEVTMPRATPVDVAVGVFLPGFDQGTGDETAGLRERIRQLTRRRLAAAGEASPLVPEAFLAELRAARW